MTDNTVLNAKDFTFAPFTLGVGGDSGALSLATLKSDAHIQYVVKSRYPEKACNEFIYDGTVLLLAVPGSGKTTVLVTRLGYMIYCSNIASGNIFTMTYTVKTTAEMKRRFGVMFGKQYADAMEFHTINSISLQIITYYGIFHGNGQPFSVIEKNAAAKIIGQIYQKINDEYPTKSTIKDICTEITYIKNMMLTAKEIEKLDSGVENMPQIYQQYCSALKQQRLMDYDDQMSYALTILKSYPAVLDYFQEKFRYICVDESQDTSKIQNCLHKSTAISLWLETKTKVYMDFAQHTPKLS